jgi:hypothetical protein
MKAKTVTGCLSAKGLRNVHARENDFTFVVGSEHYHCASYVAEFLSPRVSEMRSVDCTQNELKINIKDPDCIFKEFLSLGTGREVSIDCENRGIFASIFAELWNWELYDLQFREFEGGLTADNVVNRFLLLRKGHAPSSPELEFISSHFFAISDCLCELPFSMISEIVTHRSLRVGSEDSLYDFVMNQIRKNYEFIGLLEVIRFEYLSISKFSEFFEFVSDSFDHFTCSLWQSLRSRLLLPVAPKSSNDRASGIECHFDPSSPLKGIIAHLAQKCGGNVHDRGVVNITADRPYDGDSSHAAKNIADLTADSCFECANAENMWICYDFKNLKIWPTHYSLRSQYDGSSGFRNLKNWAIEGSKDGKSWIELDARRDNEDLNGKNLMKAYPVSCMNSIRMIRLR